MEFRRVLFRSHGCSRNETTLLIDRNPVVIRRRRCEPGRAGGGAIDVRQRDIAADRRAARLGLSLRRGLRRLQQRRLPDRKSVVEGKSVYGRVYQGGGRIIKKKKHNK